MLPTKSVKTELTPKRNVYVSDQLQEIRNVRLARLVCDNTDIIDTVQMYPMVLSDHELYVSAEHADVSLFIIRPALRDQELGHDRHWQFDKKTNT